MTRRYDSDDDRRGGRGRRRDEKRPLRGDRDDDRRGRGRRDEDEIVAPMLSRLSGSLSPERDRRGRGRRRRDSPDDRRRKKDVKLEKIPSPEKHTRYNLKPVRAINIIQVMLLGYVYPGKYYDEPDAVAAPPAKKTDAKLKTISFNSLNASQKFFLQGDGITRFIALFGFSLPLIGNILDIVLLAMLYQKYLFFWAVVTYVYTCRNCLIAFNLVMTYQVSLDLSVKTLLCLLVPMYWVNLPEIYNRHKMPFLIQIELMAWIGSVAWILKLAFFFKETLTEANTFKVIGRRTKFLLAMGFYDGVGRALMCLIVYFGLDKYDIHPFFSFMLLGIHAFVFLAYTYEYRKAKVWVTVEDIVKELTVPSGKQLGEQSFDKSKSSGKVEITAMKWHPAGHQLWFGDSEGNIHVFTWDDKDKKLSKKESFNGHSGTVKAIDIDSDTGEWCVTCSVDNWVSVWPTTCSTSIKKSGDSMKGHNVIASRGRSHEQRSSKVSCVAISRLQVIISGSDTEVIICERGYEKKFVKVQMPRKRSDRRRRDDDLDEDLKSRCTWVTFSQNGSYAYAGMYDGEIWMIHANPENEKDHMFGEILNKFRISDKPLEKGKGVDCAVSCMSEFKEKNRQLAVVSVSGSLKVIELPISNPKSTPSVKDTHLCDMQGNHSRPVTAIALCKDGKHLFSAGSCLRIWHLETGAPVSQGVSKNKDGAAVRATCGAIHPLGKFAAIGSKCGWVKYFQLGLSAKDAKYIWPKPVLPAKNADKGNTTDLGGPNGGDVEEGGGSRMPKLTNRNANNKSRDNYSSDDDRRGRGRSRRDRRRGDYSDSSETERDRRPRSSFRDRDRGRRDRYRD